MADLLDRLHTVAAGMTRAIEAADAGGAWGADSPCEGWTAGDVADHIIDNYIRVSSQPTRPCGAAVHSGRSSAMPTTIRFRSRPCDSSGAPQFAHEWPPDSLDGRRDCRAGPPRAATVPDPPRRRARLVCRHAM